MTNDLASLQNRDGARRVFAGPGSFSGGRGSHVAGRSPLSAISRMMTTGLMVRVSVFPPFRRCSVFSGWLQHQAEATAYCEARVPPGCFSREGGINPMYPASEQTASGVYSLVTYGHVSASHVEHPDTFITELLRQEQSGDCGTRSLEDTIQFMNRQVAPLPHRLTGPWKSGFGSTLEDVYRNKGVSAPRFTTKTGCVRMSCTKY